MEPVFHMVALFLLGAMSSGVLSGRTLGMEGRWTGITAMAASGLAALQLSSALQWNSVAVDALLFFMVIGLSRLALSQHPTWGKRLIQDGLTLFLAIGPILLFLQGDGGQSMVGAFLLTLGAAGGIVWMGEPIGEESGASLRRVAQMVAAFGVACVGGWWLASSPAPIFVDAALCAVFAATFLFSAAESAAPESRRGLAGRQTLTASVESDGRIRALNTPLAKVLQPGLKGLGPERLQDILTPTESVESALEEASRGVFEKKEGYIWLPGGGLTAVEFGLVRCPQTASLQCVVDPVSPGKRSSTTSTAQASALRRLAYSDPLTGGKNRRFLELELNRAVVHSMRGEEPLSLVMFDLDHFKTINDEYGHLRGDELLRTVVATCQEELRDSDSVCRYGGDEFIVLLPNTSRNAAERIATRLLRKIRISCQPLVPCPVSGSFGVLTYEASDGLQPPNHLLHSVDLALLESKRRGRNCVTVGKLARPGGVSLAVRPATT